MTIQEPTFLFFSFFSRLQRELGLARCMLLLMLSILIGGCATPIKWNPTPEEQQSIRKVGLVVKPELAGVDFLVLGATGGPLSGAAVGFMQGVFNPILWFVGGPISTTPLGAWMGAECKSELSSIENPEQRFQETMKRLELPSRLEKYVLDAFVSSAAPKMLFAEVVPSLSQESRISYSNSRGLDTLLELRIYVSLHDARATIECKGRCVPLLETKVAATLQRVSDGTLLAERSYWPDSDRKWQTLTFQELLTDQSAIVGIMDYSFIRIANMIIKWISTTPP